MPRHAWAHAGKKMENWANTLHYCADLAILHNSVFRHVRAPQQQRMRGGSKESTSGYP